MARHIEGTAKKNAMKALAIDALLVQRARGSSVMIGSEECQGWAQSEDRMKWPVVVVLTIVAAVAGVPRYAWAWGDEGHKVICEIAFRLVQPNTRAEIKKLISTDERFTSFSDSCTWPDHPRQRASEHFVNLPRDSDGLHSETCPGASACVVTAIKKDFEVLSSNNASQAQKLASLKFLGHWVGDIHQPLHVSFEDDRGGNSILVTGDMWHQSAFRLGYLPCAQGGGRRRE